MSNSTTLLLVVTGKMRQNAPIDLVSCELYLYFAVKRSVLCSNLNDFNSDFLFFFFIRKTHSHWSELRLTRMSWLSATVESAFWDPVAICCSLKLLGLACQGGSVVILKLLRLLGYEPPIYFASFLCKLVCFVEHCCFQPSKYWKKNSVRV